MPEHLIRVENPDGSLVYPEFENLKYNGKFQRYGDAQFTIPADIANQVFPAVHDRAWIDIYNADQIGRGLYKAEPLWRGFLIPGSWKNTKTKTITAWAIERQLEFRPTPPVRYSTDHTLLDIVKSSAASAGEEPGMILIANGVVYPGTFELYSGSVYKAAGWGTGSDFGDIHAGGDKIYVGDQQLSWQSGGAGSIGEWEYYQNATDLYIYCDAHPDYRVIIVENWMDTKIRVQSSDLESYSSSFPEYWEISGWKSGLYDQILRVIQGKGLEVRWKHRADGYTYLVGASSLGRGASASQLPSFEPHHVDQITSDKTTGSEGENLIVFGRGDGITQAVRSNVRSNYRGGARIIRSETFGNYTTTSLEAILGILDNGEGPTAYKVTAPIGEAQGLIEGDYCFLTPEGEQKKRVRVKEWMVEESSSGVDRSLWLNQRPKDYIDALKARKTLIEDLNTSMQRSKQNWSVSLRENIDYSSCDADPVVAEAYSIKWEFEIPDTLDDDYEKIFDLKITLDYFEASETAVTTTSHAHTGSTGSHSGYGGGTTTSNNYHSHSVSGQAAEQTAGYDVQVVGSNLSINSAGGHSHSISVGAPSGTTTVAKNVSLSGTYCSACGFTVVTGGSYGTTSVSSTGHSHGATSGSAGDHSHGKSYTPYDVAAWYHVHTVSGETTSYIAAHSHTEDTYAAKNRQVYTESDRDAPIDYYKALLAEGESVHYFDVYVYIRNSAGSWVQVSSSPYQNKAIGDSWSVDISSYVFSPGSNAIKFSVKEYNGSTPVRCRISASLGVSYSIDPFSL